MTLADRILSFKDPASREIDFCGERVLVVAATSGAAPRLFEAIRKLEGTPEELAKRPVMELALPLLPCVPDVAIYCLRDPADPLAPVFADTPEVRARLMRLPFVESSKLLATCLELLTVKE